MQSVLRHLVLGFACAAASAWALATDEVPFITSPDNVTLEMLRLADVQAGDHVIDLGSGDGRIVILAARRFGASGLGVEIDPKLVALSQKNAREAGVADRAVFREQDLFKTDLAAASVITMYLLPEVNLQLRPALLQLKPGTRLVSHDWDMADWKPDRTTVVAVPDKKVGLEKSSKVHLWVVPAKVDGLWCGTGPLHEFRLQLDQRYQEVQGTLTRKQRVRQLGGRVEGNTVRTDTTKLGALVLQANGDTLRIVEGDGMLNLLRGQVFQRTAGASCPVASG
jgi:SAM-dependent methyltransferase